MLFSRWFRRRPGQRRASRLALEVLEDRSVPIPFEGGLSLLALAAPEPGGPPEVVAPENDRPGGPAEARAPTDAPAGSLPGQGAPAADAAGAVTHFAVFARGRVLSGAATPVLVVALDDSDRAVAGYTGTVHFSSSDSQATLAPDYTFTASDHGSRLFTVMFGTPGAQTLAVTDTLSGSLGSSAEVEVLSLLLLEGALLGARGDGWWEGDG
jgi:hypothetical protein